MKEIVYIMKEVSSTDFPVKITNRKEEDPIMLVADSSKIRNTLG